MDIGMYHLKTLPVGRVINAGELFTVDDGCNVHIYERPYATSTVEIRRAVAVVFIDEQNSSLKYRVAGRYPNYHIQEVTAPHSDLGTIDLGHDLGLRSLTDPFGEEEL